MQNNDSLANLLRWKVQQRTELIIADSTGVGDGSKGYIMIDTLTPNQVLFLKDGTSVTLTRADIMDDNVMDTFCRMYTGKMTIDDFRIFLSRRNNMNSSQVSNRVTYRQSIEEQRKEAIEQYKSKVGKVDDSFFSAELKQAIDERGNRNKEKDMFFIHPINTNSNLPEKRGLIIYNGCDYIKITEKQAMIDKNLKKTIAGILYNDNISKFKEMSKIYKGNACYSYRKVDNERFGINGTERRRSNNGCCPTGSGPCNIF